MRFGACVLIAAISTLACNVDPGELTPTVVTVAGRVSDAAGSPVVVTIQAMVLESSCESRVIAVEPDLPVPTDASGRFTLIVRTLSAPADRCLRLTLRRDSNSKTADFESVKFRFTPQSDTVRADLTFP